MARLEVDVRLNGSATSSLLFLYLGRKGSLGRFTLELAEAAQGCASIRSTFAISRMNQIAQEFVGLGPSVVQLDTFEKTFSLATIANFFRLRSSLLETIRSIKPAAVVTLMPHVWTPLLARSIRATGTKYVTIIHDAVAHPGDATAVFTPWLRSETSVADVVVTLSRTVATQLSGKVRVSGKLLPLFHPDLTYGGAAASRERKPETPFRVLFLGRIMKYKGLPTLVKAIELLQAQGIDVHLGVAGSGDIQDGVRSRLAGVRAEIVNRWLEDHEIAPLLARYDAVALSHVEASQSGVAATAFGNSVPVIGVPVGGIAEQVIDGKTGVLAESATAEAFADAIQRLTDDRVLYAQISSHLTVTRRERSMDQFLQQLLVGLR